MRLSREEIEILDLLLGKRGKNAVQQAFSTLFRIFQRSATNDIQIPGLLPVFYEMFHSPRKSNAVSEYLYDHLKFKATFYRNKFPDKERFEEIFQDAFHEFHHAIYERQYEGRSNLNTYFETILRRKISRKSPKTSKIFQYIDDIPGFQEIAADEKTNALNTLLHDERTREILGMAADFVGEECIERLALFHLDGLTHEEAGAIISSERATDPRRIASDCARKLRIFYCNNLHLLDGLEGFDKIQSYYARRKKTLQSIIETIGEDCSKTLAIHVVCQVSDERIKTLLDTARNTGSPEMKAHNQNGSCYALMADFFSRQPELLKIFGLRWENGEHQSSVAADEKG